jgi:hypothetical protein
VLASINWLGQTVFSGGMVTTGGAVFAIGLMPPSWIERAVKRLAALTPYSFAI